MMHSQSIAPVHVQSIKTAVKQPPARNAAHAMQAVRDAARVEFALHIEMD